MFKKIIRAAVVFSFLTLIGASAPPLPASASAPMPAAGAANLHVIDLSHYNVPTGAGGSYNYAALNWAAVARNADAVYIKATEGRTYTDPCYGQLAASARSVGLRCGFYHYFWPNASSAADAQQADRFYDAIAGAGFACTPVLDVEEASAGDGSAALSKAGMTAAVRAFADEFRLRSGLDVMIYASNRFIDDHLSSGLASYKLWVANTTGGAPFDTSVWHSWDMWQYTGGGEVPGIPGAVDVSRATRNIFLGAVSGIVWVDQPKGTVQAAGLTVSGWALSRYGTARVDIYVDGVSLGSVWKSDFTQRADVGRLYGGSGYDDALDSGYSFTVPENTLASGTHLLRVAELDDRGNALWSAPVTFRYVAPTARISLDTPDAVYSGDVPVIGWGISPCGLSHVDIYVDGEKYSSLPASSFWDRPDIEALYAGKGYRDLAHSGFTGTVSAKGLSAGVHTLQAVQIDTGGNVLWSPIRTFTAAPAADSGSANP